MKRILSLAFLLVAVQAIAQQGKVVPMPEFTYTDNGPGKYHWQKAGTVKGRVIFNNTIACTDSIVYSVGGFDTRAVQREIDVICNGQFRKSEIQYPGKGFMNTLCFVRDSLLYVGGGVDSNKANYNWEDFWQFNMHTKAWKRLKDLPFYYRAWEAVFQDADRLIAMIPQLSGDELRTVTTQFYTYHPMTDDWELLQSVNAVPQIFSPVAFKLGEDVYVFSQSMADGAGPVNACYRFNLTTRRWAAVAPFPGRGRTLAFAGSDERYGYVGGGVLGTTAFNARDVYRFNPIGEVWERCPDLPLGLRWAKAWNFNNNIYVGFGIHDDDHSVGIWKLGLRK